MTYYHDNNEYTPLWNWFGDRRIYFIQKHDNGSVEHSIKIMLDCFEVLDYYSGSIIFKLKDDPKTLGLFDINNELQFEQEIEDDELGVIYTHDDYGQENKIVELSKVIHIDEWDNVKSEIDGRDWYDTHFDRPTDRALIDSL